MIRKAKINDVSRIAEIQIYGWRYAYSKILSEKELYSNRQVSKKIESHEKMILDGIEEYVFEENEIIKGFMIMANCRDEDKKEAFELTAIYIEPYFKRQGIGTQMLSYFEKIAIEKNMRETVVWAFANNTEGRRFYEKNGYSFDGTKKMIKEYNQEEIRYVKTLSL